jgi:hypothetical protein
VYAFLSMPALPPIYGNLLRVVSYFFLEKIRFVFFDLGPMGAIMHPRHNASRRKAAFGELRSNDIEAFAHGLA